MVCSPSGIDWQRVRRQPCHRRDGPQSQCVGRLDPAGGHGSGLRAQAPASEFLVSEGKAGSVEVGMAVDDVLQAFGKERVHWSTCTRKDGFSPAIEIDLPGSGVRAPLVAGITEGPCGGFSLRGITIRDPSSGRSTVSVLDQHSRVQQRERSVRISREEVGRRSCPTPVFWTGGSSRDQWSARHSRLAVAGCEDRS